MRIRTPVLATAAALALAACVVDNVSFPSFQHPGCTAWK
jgi:hypothetical protein